VDLNARGRLAILANEEGLISLGVRWQEQSEWVPIDEVAVRFGIRASAIRYYEQRGLLHPVSRHAGRRWYGQAEIRRLAIIQYWQRRGQMSLDEIADILAGPAATRGWARIVQGRIDGLRRQVDQMNQAREHLEHVLAHHPDSRPDGCHHYEAWIMNPQPGDTAPDGVRSP